MHALYRNHMGNDLEVAKDARISFDADTQAEGWDMQEVVNPCPTVPDHQRVYFLPRLNKGDRNLIQFLARGCRTGQWKDLINDLQGELSPTEISDLLKHVKRMPTHWTPFGQQVIKLRMKAPVPVRTQAFKSKIGFVENEESRRYITSTPELFVPEYRTAPEKDIKQGSGGPHPDNEFWKAAYAQKCEDMIAFYERQIQAGIAPEQARFSLPQGVYVNWVWTGSLYAFAEFCNKRKDSHAQGEIQKLANAVSEIIEPLYPVSWAALTE